LNPEAPHCDQALIRFHPIKKAVMPYASLPAGRFAEADFRVGGALGRTSAVLSRNFPTFFVVTAIASLPKYLLTQGVIPAPDDWLLALLLSVLGVFLWVVLATMSQAIVLYGAFQDMRGRGFKMGESVQIGLRRFFPVIGVATAVTLLGFLGLILFVLPGLLFFTQWFVAMPACVVEERGVWSSMGRSWELTLEHRWKIFGLMTLMYLADSMVDSALDQTLSLAAGSLAAGSIPVLAGHVIWSGIWGAFFAILAVVTYHDLRVAKEGVDTEQIAAVFE
jgi:hypothetical protein